MNRDRKPVQLPEVAIRRAKKFGDDMVAYYASDVGRLSRSAAVSGIYGAQANAGRQYQGKIGEVATALYYGINPNTEIKWDASAGADRGFDVVVRQVRCDVKTSLPPYNLIWPKPINHLFFEKAFEAMVSVSISPDDDSMCWLEGWIGKEEFFIRKLVADGSLQSPRLDPGTWYVPKEWLHGPDFLTLTACSTVPYGVGAVDGNAPN